MQGYDKVDVSICLLLKKDFATHIHSFELLGVEEREIETEYIVSPKDKKYGLYIQHLRVEVLVAYYPQSDTPYLKKYFDTFTEKTFEVDNLQNDSQVYNELFRMAIGTNICVLKPNTFLRLSWLTDLLFYNQLVLQTGVCGIIDDYSKIEFLPLLTTENETMMSVLIPESNYLDAEGVMFFNRQLLFHVGALDEHPDLNGSEWEQWQLRALALGYNNYYIPSQTSYIANKGEEVFCKKFLRDVSKKQLETSLLEMKKAKNFYIPLEQINPSNICTDKTA